MKKRLLCLVLSLVMLLSATVVVAHAAETGELLLHNLDAVSGWTSDAANKTEGAASVTTNHSGSAGIGLNFKLDEAVDASDYAGFKLDFYVSDADILKDITFVIELTSSGSSDHAENAYIGKLPNLSDGWNTVSLYVSDFAHVTDGGVDMAAINYFRIYSLGFTVPDGETLTVNVDNIRFTDRGTVMLSAKSASLGTKAAGSYTSAQVGFYSASFNSVDISEMTETGVIKFDYQFTGDADKVKMRFEIGSDADTDGVNELSYYFYLNELGDYIEENAESGWYTAAIPLSVFDDNTCDLTNIVRIRILNWGSAELTQDSSITIKNVRVFDSLPELESEPEFSSAVAAFLNVFKKFTVLQHMPVFGKIFGFAN